MLNTARRSSWLSSLATAIFLGLMALLSGCGGGGASSSDVQPLSVVPGSATVYAYSDTPTVLTIRGGKAPFNIYSDNTAVISFNNATMPGGLVPNETIVLEGPSGQYGRVNNVEYQGSVNTNPTGTITGAKGTNVTLTVRDADGTQTTVVVTVMPSTLNSSLVVTNPLNSGAQGVASVTASNVTGAALLGHRIRFDVVQGSYQLACDSTSSGSGCTTTADSTGRVISVVTATDMNGVASTVVKADPLAVTGFGIIRATDLDSGHTLTSQFVISGVALMVLPSTITIANPTSTAPAKACQATTATFFIYGGTPPYIVMSSDAQIATISGAASTGLYTVSANGGSFVANTVGASTADSAVTPNPTQTHCGSVTFSIVDGAGNTATATLNNAAN